MVWHEAALTGTTSHEFSEQIAALEPFLAKNWQAQGEARRPATRCTSSRSALVLYRDDYRFLLDDVIPKRGQARADYDMVIASQPYRLRAPLEFKAQKVVAPLVRALGKGGRLLGIHSHGQDPGLEIIQQVWPGENPYTQSRHDLLRVVKTELGKDARRYNFNTYADARSLFRYDMHTLPSEISSAIGTSTLFAAWNAAIYVAQIDDQRLGEVLRQDAATSTRRAKCCRSTAACGSRTSRMSSPASAIELSLQRAARRAGGGELPRARAARAAPRGRDGRAAAGQHLRLHPVAARPAARPHPGGDRRAARRRPRSGAARLRAAHPGPR